jgi:predicted homoserine dehydrogenase-like protein
VTMRHAVDAGAILTYDDVVIDASDSAVTARRQMESAFNPSHRT